LGTPSLLFYCTLYTDCPDKGVKEGSDLKDVILPLKTVATRHRQATYRNKHW